MQSPSKLEASFSTLVLSVASSAAMSLGLAPDPATGKSTVDKSMAQLNINLLEVLQVKTKGNLTQEETSLLEQMINDLKLKFVELK